MIEPSPRLLIEVAKAIKQSPHRNVSEHLAAGFLWSLYPEWFDRCWADRKNLVSMTTPLKVKP